MRARPSLVLAALLLSGVAAAVAAACSLVAGLDDLQFTDAGACAQPCVPSRMSACISSGCVVAGVCRGELIAENTACDAGSTSPGACDDAGTCFATCAFTADCPPTTGPCVTVDCAMQRCIYANLADGTPTPDAATGDCLRHVCANGVETTSEDDDNPPSAAGPCYQTPTCVNGVPSTPPMPFGTPCGADGGQLCNDAGMCGCTKDTDCPAPDTCGGGNPGTQGFCGCTRQTCETLHQTCGPADAGCDASLDCDDQDANGSETDVDCGGDGGTCAISCGLTKKCNLTSDCMTGLTCVDGVCCTASSCSTCTSCNVGAHAGACWDIAKNGTDGTRCTGDKACNGKGVCLGRGGAHCTSNAQCLSDDCETGGLCDGVQ